MPKRWVRRNAESVAENAGAAGILGNAAEKGRQFFDERGTVRADRRKKFRMAKCEMERAVAAHGSSGDGAVGAAGSRAETFFDAWKKFLHEEIFVASFSVVRIDVERRAGSGCCNQKFANLVSFPKIFDKVPSAGVDEHLFVIAEAMEEIEDGEALRLVCVVTWRKQNAIRNGMSENFAGQGIAFDAASGSEGRRRAQEKEKNGE